MSTSARIGAAASTLWPERVFVRPVSREEFRNLPLLKILFPTLDGPTLHFSGTAVARASVMATRLDELRPRYAGMQKSLAHSQTTEAHGSTRAKLINIAKEARGEHLRRVALADGYAWPEFPGCWFLFEGEPDPYE